MTVIAYDKPVKDLIDELSATGHVTHTAYTKKSVTLHHNAGRLSHEGVLKVWQTRPASAHFDVDAVGAVAQYVKVNEYAWATGNTTGNRESISIEMANSTLSPEWGVSETTWKSACRLAGWLFAKVVKARPSASNFFYHHHWYATACAGPYMDKVYSQALAEAQRWYDYFTKPATAPAPAPKPIPGATYTGSRTIDVSVLQYAATRPTYRSEAAHRWNGLVWAWLCKNNPTYCRNNLAAWQKESAYVFGREGQRATQELYRILSKRDPRNFQPVTLPTWPGSKGVRAVGGTPV